MRKGDRSETTRLLRIIKSPSLPRSKRTPIANLARRAGQLDLAMRIMTPIVRPKTPISPSPTSEELATYALILLGLGAQEECEMVLGQADEASPEVLLAQAFSRIRSWNYKDAIEFLEKYIECQGLSDYQIMIARVNLAASLIATGALQSGRKMLEKIRLETERESWTLLHRNSLELLAQTAVLENKPSQARKILEKFDDRDDDLFVQKWLAIAALKEAPNRSSRRMGLAAVKKQATKLRHWETVRDCDYHLALASEDQDLMLKVYFGTPHFAFRERVRTTCSNWLKLSDSHIMTLTGVPYADRQFDLKNAIELENSNVCLPKEKALHKALRTLASDLYRPFMVGSLFSAVYRGEYYNHASSPQRVSYLVHRLRTWLELSDIPVEISNDRDGYRLSPSKKYGFVYRDFSVEQKTAGHEPFRDWIARLEPLRGTDFSVHAVASQIPTSERSARSFLSWAIDSGVLARIGSGRSIRYRFV